MTTAKVQSEGEDQRGGNIYISIQIYIISISISFLISISLSVFISVSVSAFVAISVSISVSIYSGRH